MKYALFMVAASLVATTASASEVCEIGNQLLTKPTFDGSGERQVYSIECTSYEVFRGERIFYRDLLGLGDVYFSKYDRLKIKKMLVEGGFSASGQCGAFETYVKL